MSKNLQRNECKSGRDRLQGHALLLHRNGLDAKDAEGVHSTTAKDLAKIMRYCIMISTAKRDISRSYQGKGISVPGYGKETVIFLS